MTKPVITLQAPAKDELGWEYPQALIAFFHLGANTYTAFDATEADPIYKESSLLSEIKFKANFWPNATTKQQKRRSRPIYVLEDGELLYDEDDEPLNVFEIDTTKPQYASIVNNPNMDTFTKIKTCIEKFYREEVAR